MNQILVIAYALCGFVTVTVAIWINVADDQEAYFWGVVLWPFLLVAMLCSIIRSIWTGRDLFHAEERSRVRRHYNPRSIAGLLRLRTKRRPKKRP